MSKKAQIKVGTAPPQDPPGADVWYEKHQNPKKIIAHCNTEAGNLDLQIPDDWIEDGIKLTVKKIKSDPNYVRVRTSPRIPQEKQIDVMLDLPLEEKEVIK